MRLLARGDLMIIMNFAKQDETETRQLIYALVVIMEFWVWKVQKKHNNCSSLSREKLYLHECYQNVASETRRRWCPDPAKLVWMNWVMALAILTLLTTWEFIIGFEWESLLLKRLLRITTRTTTLRTTMRTTLRTTIRITLRTSRRTTLRTTISTTLRTTMRPTQRTTIRTTLRTTSTDYLK